MAEPRTARISLDATGGGTVEVDGHDISHTVRGLTLKSDVGSEPQLVLDLTIHTGEIDGQAHVHIPADTAATLVDLGWTPPDDGQPVDLTDPKRHDAIVKIIKAEQRRDPHWFRALLRREQRIHGGRPDWLQPGAMPTARPLARLVKIDGVMTEGDAHKAREAIRQMEADPDGPKEGMVVQPYQDHGERRWVFRCWGTDDGCDGLLSLGHDSEAWAQRARERHVSEAHARPSSP